MSRLLGIGVCQLNTIPADMEKNLRSLVTQIKIMLTYSPWIKLVCAPELCLRGPFRMENTAETIPGPITQFCSELASKHEIYLIPGVTPRWCRKPDHLVALSKDGWAFLEFCLTGFR